MNYKYLNRLLCRKHCFSWPLLLTLNLKAIQHSTILGVAYSPTLLYLLSTSVFLQVISALLCHLKDIVHQVMFGQA